VIKLYKLTLSEIFTCKLDGETYGLLNHYPTMVKWWVDQAKESPVSFSGFRNYFYNAWKSAWGTYNSQHAQTSCLVAYNLLKLSEGQTRKEEEVKGNFAVISPRIVKIEDGEKLVFPTRPPKKGHVQLLPKNQTQKTLVEQAQNQYWQISQVFLTPNWCVIPFVRYLDLTKEKEDILVQKLLK
jgi:hypothetical protein